MANNSANNSTNNSTNNSPNNLVQDLVNEEMVKCFIEAVEYGKTHDYENFSLLDNDEADDDGTWIWLPSPVGGVTFIVFISYVSEAEKPYDKIQIYAWDRGIYNQGVRKKGGLEENIKKFTLNGKHLVTEQGVNKVNVNYAPVDLPRKLIATWDNKDINTKLIKALTVLKLWRDRQLKL